MSLSWDNETMFYVADDIESLREWSPAGNKFSDERDYYGAVAVTKSNKMIFTGVKDAPGKAGNLKYFRNPISGPSADYFFAHDDKGVRNIFITSEDKYLITTGGDGTVMIFLIQDKEGRGGVLGEGFKANCNNIMVTRQETEDLITTRDNLLALLNDEQSPHANNLDIGGKIDDTIKGLNDEIQTQNIGN
jgi:WD40 repeat protein